MCLTFAALILGNAYCFCIFLLLKLTYNVQASFFTVWFQLQRFGNFIENKITLWDVKTNVIQLKSLDYLTAVIQILDQNNIDSKMNKIPP